MGEAIRKLRASGGVQPPRPPRERVSFQLTLEAIRRLKEGHALLTQAQEERKLPKASFDTFLEHLMISGLDALAQSLAGKMSAAEKENRRILTPAEAHRELVMADAVANQQGRRTVGATPMFHR